jgi:hypothetical protein
MPKLAPVKAIKLPAVKPATAEEMMLRTVVLVVTINGIGNHRKVDPGILNLNDEDVDMNWLNTTKKLFKADALDKIQSIGNKAKAFVLSRASTHTYIKPGVYLLAKAFQTEVNDKLKEFDAEMKPYIEQLANGLEEHKAEAKQRLGPLYDESQYPTADYLRNAFRLTWRYLYIDSAEGLTKELAEEERKKTVAFWNETRNNIQQLLRAEFMEKLNSFIERLTPDEQGKTKKLRDGSITKFQDFCTTFSPRDCTNDAATRILVEQAQALLKDADGEGIQDNDQWRAHMKHGFETIKTILDPLIVNRPHRAIQLED